MMQNPAPVVECYEILFIAFNFQCSAAKISHACHEHIQQTLTWYPYLEFSSVVRRISLNTSISQTTPRVLSNPPSTHSTDICQTDALSTIQQTQHYTLTSVGSPLYSSSVSFRNERSKIKSPQKVRIKRNAN